MLNFSLAISESNGIPKYKQIINSLIEQIQSGKLKYGQKIPSINQISFDYYLSRDTVEKAYRILKEEGIIESVRGRGHFISTTNPTSELKILVIFNKLSSYKKEIYNAFVSALPENKIIDLHIYHYNYDLFENIINAHLTGYNYYVIMPHFLKFNPQTVNDLLKKINQEKIIILDQKIDGINHYGSCIYQDFKMDLYDAMMSAISLFKKYQILILVFPNNSDFPYPKEIIQGFTRFCGFNKFKSELIHEIKSDHQLKKGSAYVVIDESDLINFIKIQRNSNLKLTKDIGVLSYNHTPLKEILSDGISVISTDFQNMGAMAARVISDKTTIFSRNKFTFIQRNSL